MSVKSHRVQKCHWKNSIMATEWFLSWIDWKMCLDNNVQREWLRWQNCYYFRQCDNGWLLLMWPLCSRRCWGRGWSGLGVRCKDWNHFEWSNWTFDDCHSLISQMTIYQFTSRKLTQQNDHSAALREQWSRGIVHHFISSQFEVSWCNISRPFGRLQLCFKHWTLNTSFQTPQSLLHGL